MLFKDKQKALLQAWAHLRQTDEKWKTILWSESKWEIARGHMGTSQTCEPLKTSGALWTQRCDTGSPELLTIWNPVTRMGNQIPQLLQGVFNGRGFATK